MNLKQKFTSRKFWVALVTLIAGVLGMLGAEENIVQIITGGVLALAPTIIYIITEGKIDAASVGSALQTIGSTVGYVAVEMDKSANVEPDEEDQIPLITREEIGNFDE